MYSTIQKDLAQHLNDNYVGSSQEMDKVISASLHLELTLFAREFIADFACGLLWVRAATE
jgi:hypothetical protein